MPKDLKSYRSYQMESSLIKASWPLIFLAALFGAAAFLLIPLLKKKTATQKDLKVISIKRVQPKKEKLKKPPEPKKKIVENKTKKKPKKIKQKVAPKAPKPPSPRLKLALNPNPTKKTLTFKFDFDTKFDLKKFPQNAIVSNQAPSEDFSEGVAIDFSGLFEEGQLDKEITATRRRSPRYPSAAKRRKIEVIVQCSFTVKTDGTVEDIEILQTVPAGHETLFERACRRALSRWKFTPGTKNGTPVRVKVYQDLQFKLKK